MNIYDLISRAQKLRKETQLDSVSPDRVGGLHEDTLKYINEFQLLASSPSLHKIYASVSAMRSDKSPKSDLTGKPLKPGQLVVIVPASQSDATAGDVYRYDGPSGNTSAWTFVAKIGAVPADAELSATSANPVQNKVVTEKLTELESETGGGFFTLKAQAVISDTGKVASSITGLDSTDYIPIAQGVRVGVFGGWRNVDSKITPIAFYDENKIFLSAYTGENNATGEFYYEPDEVPVGAKYIRCCANTLRYPNPIIFGCGIKGAIDYINSHSLDINKRIDKTEVYTGYVSVIYDALYNVSGGENGLQPSTAFDYVEGRIIKDTGSLIVEGATPTLIIFFDEPNISSTTLATFSSKNEVAIPEGAKYYAVDFRKTDNPDGYANLRIRQSGGSADINDILTYENAMVATQVALPSSDLNTIGGHHIYLLADSYQYENAPYANAIGFLRVTTTGQFTLQEFYPFSGNKLFKRRGSISSNTWTEWGEISGTGVIQNITNEYNYPEYNASYEISVIPEITTSTNNFLAAKTDGSDRTAEIVAMLQSTGICRLGAGTFKVKDLVMPDNSMIIGSGASTKVLLADDGDFAIKMTDYCSVKDLSVMGSESNISVSENLQERHGILWQGDFAQTENYANQPYMGHIDNVWISRFAGGGITCYNTGYGTSNMLEVVNVSINNCSAGINISYWSEFHKFTNVRCSSCYYGCINNGGNNVFVNCDFSSSTGVAFLMDNSQNQSPNNSHGSAIGCVFNHTASNTGIGVKILNNDAGFIFDGCQFFYSQIYIEESDGVLVGNSNFGQANCDITIKGGGAVLFANNLFKGSPAINISGNTKTKFVNCLVRSTGAEIVI